MVFPSSLDSEAGGATLGSGINLVLGCYGVEGVRPLKKPFSRVLGGLAFRGERCSPPHLALQHRTKVAGLSGGKHSSKGKTKGFE